MGSKLLDEPPDTQSHDSTRLGRSEDDPRTAEARYQALVDRLPLAVYTARLDAGSSVTEIGSQIATILGYGPEEWLEDAAFLEKILHVEDRARVLAEIALQNETGKHSRLEYRAIAKDGRVVWILDDARVEEDAPGKPACVRGYMIDITDFKEAQRRLGEAEERYRRLVEEVPLVTYLDEPGVACTPMYLSPQIEQILGYSLDEWRADPEFFFAHVHPDDVGWVREEVERFLATGELVSPEYRMIAKDGRVVWFRDEASLERDDEGTVLGVRGYMLDITDQKRAEQDLLRRDSILEAVSAGAERLLASLQPDDSIADLLALLGQAARASRAYLFEHRAEQGSLRAYLTHEWDAPGIPSEAADPRWQGFPLEGPEFAGWLERFRQGEPLYGRTSELPAAERPMWEVSDVRSFLSVPVFVGDELWGDLSFDDCLAERDWSSAEIEALRIAASTIGAAIDRHRAEAALRESEELLAQSQRLEAVGRLASGIAHDFNNLLTAIIGYDELLLAGLDEESALRVAAEEIGRAAASATDLTGRLLAFGRRQMLQPRVIDLNVAVREAVTMLGRLLGEDVELAISLDTELRPLNADPGQLHQVIVNLAVNARDAMPDGGRLTVVTRNAEIGGDDDPGSPEVGPGKYVCLAVTDTGTGMSEETKSRLFEPFFTTKGAGEGSGLGLATVYGIVKQSGGAVVVGSEPGNGTTFEVYLPSVEERPGPPKEPAAQPDLDRGDATILLVEDDDQVRELTCALLEARGYTTIVARDGIEALALAARQQGPIDLLVTDVVMPRLGGRALAERLAARLPGLPVLYISGYTDDAAVLGGASGTPARFLAKPFTPDMLAGKVLEALTASRARSGPS